MKLTLGTNISSLTAQRQLSRASEENSKALERLSSGLRINSAADDAAGLSVSMTLATKSRTFAQALRNVNDGVSFFSIADNALQSMSDITQRQMELTEQASNGTLSAQQRTSLSTEANALRDEYIRIVKTTKFNGVSVFGATDRNVQLQVGTEGSDVLNASKINREIANDLGDGTFSTSGSVPGATNVFSIRIGDFNGDGNLDQIVTTTTNSQVRLGDGAGNFTVKQTGIGNVGSTAVGDVDGDGILDFINRDFSTDKITIYKGNGDGTFAAPKTTASPFADAAVYTGDFNGDGKLDLLLYGETGAGNAVIQLGNGDGTFQANQALGALGASGDFVVGDTNNDGKSDLLFYRGGTLQVALGTGSGVGSFSGLAGTAGFEGQLGDIDGDGKADIVARSGNTFYGLSGNGDGTFKSAVTVANLSGVTGYQVKDLDGDGDVDIFAIGTGNISSILNKGDGTFQAGFTSATIPQDEFSTLADFNNDGLPDFVVGYSSFTSPMQLYIGHAILDLSTTTTSQKALDYLAGRLQKINTERSVVGATLSRLSTISRVIGTTKENYDSARSRIIDADIAQESANLVRTQISQQAAASVLAQANQQPKLALSLLGG